MNPAHTYRRGWKNWGIEFLHKEVWPYQRGSYFLAAELLLICPTTPALVWRSLPNMQQEIKGWLGNCRYWLSIQLKTSVKFYKVIGGGHTWLAFLYPIRTRLVKRIRHAGQCGVVEFPPTVYALQVMIQTPPRYTPYTFQFISKPEHPKKIKRHCACLPMALGVRSDDIRSNDRGNPLEGNNIFELELLPRSFVKLIQELSHRISFFPKIWWK